MSKFDLEAHKQMTPAAVQQWLTRSLVVASTVAVAFVMIAANNFGRGLNADPSASADTILQASATPRLQ